MSRRIISFSRSIQVLSGRSLHSSARFLRQHENVDEHRKIQMEKPLNPRLANTTSSMTKNIPKVGSDKAPPELLSSADPELTVEDSQAGKTETTTGATQYSSDKQNAGSDLNVGEIEGGTFRVEPLRRTGEDASTMRARLLCLFYLTLPSFLYWDVLLIDISRVLDQSRKRGTLESDLLLSTFADTYLETMTAEQLKQYDLFLDENDWDIYYWATQEPISASVETTESGKEQYLQQSPRPGEWAQTVGTFKAAYRPVPSRLEGSEILNLLRDHVKNKRKDGMAFMPRLRNFN
jgi:succinate dehydrogenase flavin-adding protein (antitoxin of CptAB toxin-antitoxin module)